MSRGCDIMLEQPSYFLFMLIASVDLPVDIVEVVIGYMLLLLLVLEEEVCRVVL